MTAPPDLRLGAAVLAGKAAGAASRLLRRGGGTTLPGDVAMAVDPAVLDKLGRTLPLGSVLVTGTNGKTTTAGLLTAALEAEGRRVVSNTSGANLVFGVCAAAVADARPSGRARASIGVFEVDELWLERTVAALRPRAVVVLNLLRDQLDRSGELESTAAHVGRALRRLPDGAAVVANADDPLVAAQCRGLPGVVPFGIDAVDHLLPGLPHVADARTCPVCGTPLRFERVVLAHCGTYACPAGDFARPAPRFAVVEAAAPAIDALRLRISDGTEIAAAVGGMYNAYNAVAAYAALRSLGVAADAAARGLRTFRPRFGRQERIRMHGRAMRLLLAKNPAGFDEVLRTADELGQARAYLIAINDRIADGRDVSWLWDVDFERLAVSASTPQVVASGTRAHDLALRLKYAGVPADRVVLEPEPEAALRRAAGLAGDGDDVMVVATYTAMLALRAVAERAGAAAPYWSGTGGAPA